MASLTIRKLDEAIKSYLRLRSATNGRSVEEEVRVILREYTEGRPVEGAALLRPPEAASPAPRAANATGQNRVTLIIGGGIAAYKGCELIRLCRKAGIELDRKVLAGIAVEDPGAFGKIAEQAKSALDSGTGD